MIFPNFWPCQQNTAGFWIHTLSLWFVEYVRIFCMDFYLIVLLVVFGVSGISVLLLNWLSVTYCAAAVRANNQMSLIVYFRCFFAIAIILIDIFTCILTKILFSVVVQRKIHWDFILLVSSIDMSRDYNLHGGHIGESKAIRWKGD